MIRTSKYLTIDQRDFLRGLAAAVAGAVWAIVAPIVTEVVAHPGTAKLSFDWQSIWHTAAATGILYIGAKFLKKSEIKTEAE